MDCSGGTWCVLPVCVGQKNLWVLGCAHCSLGQAMLTMFSAGTHVYNEQLAHACVREVSAFYSARDQRVILQSATCLSSHHL